MTAKEYLSGIKASDIKINNKQKELDLLLKGRSYVSGIDYSGVKVQTSTSIEGFTALSDRIADLATEINQDIDTFVDMRHEIIDQIHQLDKPEYIDILFRRYVEGQSLEQIAADMGYSYHWCCHMHGEALKEFEKSATFRN